MRYKNSQYERVKTLIRDQEVFYGDCGFGNFRANPYEFILSDCKNNLYSPVGVEVLDYFAYNNITWWNGELTNHPLSSQVACLNHLFPIRKNRNSVLSIVNGFYPEIIDVLPIPTDKHTPAYIQFEAVSHVDHLNEKNLTRGSNCTSIDALIYGVHRNGKRILVPIEWKFVEAYGDEDKAVGKSGATRIKRYSDLINNSEQLMTDNPNAFYYEPFYQLMRQTLWAEQMVAQKRDEIIEAEDYIHIHVVPKENKELLEKIYAVSGKNMEDTWRSLIRDQGKYKIIAPDELFLPIRGDDNHRELIEYLQKRYW